MPDGDGDDRRRIKTRWGWRDAHVFATCPVAPDEILRRGGLVQSEIHGHLARDGRDDIPDGRSVIAGSGFVHAPETFRGPGRTPEEACRVMLRRWRAMKRRWEWS